MQPLDAQDRLRHLLNEWDPIGVADAVRDEYDCMIGPLLGRLAHGAGRSEVSEFLRFEPEHHFGLDPAFQGVDSMANRLVSWWASAVPS